jgi:hypothetical protein
MLPEEEAGKIKQLTLLFPEVKEEVEQISASLISLASSAAPAPSPSVKDKLMDKLKQLNNEERKYPFSISATTDADTSKSEEPTLAPVIPIQKRKANPLLVAASVFGLVLSIGLIMYLTSLNRQHRSELALLHQQMESLNKGMTKEQQKNLAFSQTLEMMQNNDYKKINLNNVPGKPPAFVQLFWNTKTHEVYIADVSLPKTSSDKQYQLWAIVDGKPVDAGMLSDVKQVAQKMKSFPKADAFAITLEKKGGSPTPTLEAMFVMGKV